MAEFTEIEDDTITIETLKAASGEFDVTSIHYLDLKQKGIVNLGCIGQCDSLERLDVSRNSISILLPLNNLKQLTDLNVSANQIKTLDILGECREMNMKAEASIALTMESMKN
ncbi:leucine-rich repeat-containing protein 61-like [Anneissia japonica]|uniref:leucine-rich repeat-containing protein 61-like n=1 Tax=Anneissia japonica TaxID=1529436 RepID=UPI001425996A|nr:leucine-rich repeat-containing protein 61-like [Anneissia japonica]